MNLRVNLHIIHTGLIYTVIFPIKLESSAVIVHTHAFCVYNLFAIKFPYINVFTDVTFTVMIRVL